MCQQTKPAAARNVTFHGGGGYHIGTFPGNEFEWLSSFYPPREGYLVETQEQLPQLKTDDSAKVCDVSKSPYLAKGDGVTLNTVALQKAIDDCAGTAEAAGTVLLPASGSAGTNGTAYVSGALFLRSHIVLHISPGAVLRGSAILKDNATWPWTYKRIAGFMEFGHASLLNGAVCKQMKPACPTGCKGQDLGDQCAEWTKLQNVAMQGGGTIDGDGTSWLKPPYVNIRPVLMHLAWIDGLIIEDLLITRPPFWTIHPVFSTNMVVRNCSVQTVGIGNGDGIDVVRKPTNLLHHFMKHVSFSSVCTELAGLFRTQHPTC